MYRRVARYLRPASCAKIFSMANDNIWVFGQVLCGEVPAVGARVRVWLRVDRGSQGRLADNTPVETTTGGKGGWSISLNSADFVTNSINFEGINFRVSCPDCPSSNALESDPAHALLLTPKSKKVLQAWVEELIDPRDNILAALGVNLPPWLDLMSLSSVTWVVYAGRAQRVKCPVKKSGRRPR